MINRQFGFTLMELLIAMTLMGLILVVLYGGLRLGIRSWEAGEQQVETVNGIRLAQDFIRRQVQQSVTTFHNDSIRGRVVVFEGETERMAMVAPMLEYLGLGGLYFIEIDTIEDSETGHLRMRWWPYSPKTLEDNVDDEDIEETVLLSGISEVQWSYFGPREAEQDSDWHDEWENQSQRPLLVRLRLRHQGKPWPELVAAVFSYSSGTP